MLEVRKERPPKARRLRSFGNLTKRTGEEKRTGKERLDLLESNFPHHSLGVESKPEEKLWE